jgi:ADP-heptose:LPS heptosyltransferase
MGKNIKILLLMCEWIGDTFWAMQVIPAIKKNYPDAEVWVGVKPHSKDLLYGLIDDDKIIVLKNVISDRRREKFSFLQYFHELKKVRKERFDIAIDFTGNRYSVIFVYLASIKKRVGLNINRFSFLYNIKGEKFDAKKHWINKALETVDLLFPIKASPKMLPAKSGVDKLQLQKKLNFSLDEKLALIMPGAGWNKKKWDTENFIKVGCFLLEKRYKIIIASSQEEKGLCRTIQEKVKNSFIFTRPLEELIALIPHVNIAISNDSGPGHLLAAADVKTITIFCGDTDLQRCCPMGENVVVFKTKDRHSGLSKVLMHVNEFIDSVK